MTDQRSPDELERRLASAFRQADLPGASPVLRDALEKVPDAPVTAAGSSAGRRGRGSGSGWALLGVAAVLLVGGALAIGVGGLRPSPSTTVDATPTTAAPAEPATRLTFQAQWTAERPESPADIAAIETVLRRRLEALGSADHRVESLGGGRFLVELPAGVDVDAVRGVLGVRGEAAFVPLGDQAANVGERIDTAGALFGSEGIVGADVGADQTGLRVITIHLTPPAAETFRAWTAVNIGAYLAIVVDGIVLSAPTVQDEIPGGKVRISQSGVDGWKADEANRVVSVLSSGPYPVPIVELGADPGPSPVATEPAGPSPSPSASAGQVPEFSLTRVRGDMGCDAMLPPYRAWVFHVDPSAGTEPVWAVAETGARLRVEWGSEFRGLVGPPPAIVDGEGIVVARDGTRGGIPRGGWPSLGDHFVCPGPETLYIFNEPPTN